MTVSNVAQGDGPHPQSGRTISNCNDPDGLLIQICKKTAAGTYKNWE